MEIEIKKGLEKINKFCSVEKMDFTENELTKEVVIKKGAPLLKIIGDIMIHATFFICLILIPLISNPRNYIVLIVIFLIVLAMSFVLFFISYEETISRKKIYNKELNLAEMKSLEETISWIKNSMTENEFSEVLLKNKQITGRDIGNAYFYNILFLNYKSILEKIRRDEIEKEILVKIFNTKI